MQNPSVGNRTDRTFVTGKTRVVRVDVIRLDKSDEAHEQHAEQGQSPEPCRAIVCFRAANQTGTTPQDFINSTTLTGSEGRLKGHERRISVIEAGPQDTSAMPCEVTKVASNIP